MKTYSIKNWNTGQILHKGKYWSISDCIEDALAKNINLDFADLRNMNLMNANLDGLYGHNINFSGSNLMGANLSDASLHTACFKNTNLQAVCFAESTLERCDFTGSLFGSTDLAGCNVTHCRFDTLSALSQNFIDTQNIYKCLYFHGKNEDCVFSSPPVFIKGLELPIILFDTHMKLGPSLKSYPEWILHMNMPDPQNSDLSCYTHQFFKNYAATLMLLAEQNGYQSFNIPICAAINYGSSRC